MNYQWHYDRLIETRKDRVLEEGVYYERHHIVMKSMGGTDVPENLVLLTAREHFLAHWLLWMIHRNVQSAFAFSMMRVKGNRNHRKICTAREYSFIRESLSFASSQIDRSGSKNPRWGIKWSTAQYENLKARKVGAFRSREGMMNPMIREVYQYDVHGKLIKKWNYAKECIDFYESIGIRISKGNLSSSAKFNSTSELMLKRTNNFIFSFSPIHQSIFDRWKIRYPKKRCHHE